MKRRRVTSRREMRFLRGVAAGKIHKPGLSEREAKGMLRGVRAGELPEAAGTDHEDDRRREILNPLTGRSFERKEFGKPAVPAPVHEASPREQRAWREEQARVFRAAGPSERMRMEQGLVREIRNRERTWLDPRERVALPKSALEELLRAIQAEDRRH